MFYLKVLRALPRIFILRRDQSVAPVIINTRFSFPFDNAINVVSFQSRFIWSKKYNLYFWSKYIYDIFCIFDIFDRNILNIFDRKKNIYIFCAPAFVFCIKHEVKCFNIFLWMYYRAFRLVVWYSFVFFKQQLLLAEIIHLIYFSQ